jgi:hypothetical protein
MLRVPYPEKILQWQYSALSCVLSCLFRYVLLTDEPIDVKKSEDWRGLNSNEPLTGE